MTRTGFYPGSFDPPTFGHCDVIAQALHVVDRLVIGIGTHVSKSALFSPDERQTMMAAIIADRHEGAHVDIESFSGLAIAAARACGAGLLVRGLRGGGDYDDEVTLAGMNRQLAPDIITIWLPSAASTRSITSSLVRQIARMGGDVAPFVPEAVIAPLYRRCSA